MSRLMNSRQNSQLASAPPSIDPVASLHHFSTNTPTSLGRLQLPSTSTEYPDSDSSDSDFTTSSRPSQTLRAVNNSHSRSMSNPFPSLFAGKKKRQGSFGKTLQDAGPSTQKNLPVPSHGTAQGHERRPSAGSQEFLTGQCMTCSSLVRWPKGITVFKCMICSTVNDLAPKKDVLRDAAAAWSADGSAQHPTSVPTISIRRTQNLTRSCLRTHLSRTCCKSSPNLDHLTREGQGPRLHDDTHRREDPKFAEQPLDGRASHFAFKEQPTLRRATDRFEKMTLGPDAVRRPNDGHARSRSSQDPASTQQGTKGYADSPEARQIFKQLEDYLIDCFRSFDTINSSFLVWSQLASSDRRGSQAANDRSDHRHQQPHQAREPAQNGTPGEAASLQSQGEVSEMDPRVLMLGDVAENGQWWTGGLNECQISHRHNPRQTNTKRTRETSPKSPHIQWDEVNAWYASILSPAETWLETLDEVSKDPSYQQPSEGELRRIERDLLLAQEHVQKTCLKATENLLKRPGRLMKSPDNLRFLLIILENPLLYPRPSCFQGLLQGDLPSLARQKQTFPVPGLLSGQHSGLIKRIFGLISNSSPECHNFIIAWLGRVSHSRFTRIKDLASRFLIYRMLRQGDRTNRDRDIDVTAGLIPEMQIGRSGAYLHDEIGSSSKPRKAKGPSKTAAYAEDWQVKATARFLSLVFAANSTPLSKRSRDALDGDMGVSIRMHEKSLPTSDFYVSLADDIDLVADFETWEAKKPRFSFCQYPFLLSIWAKTKILEYDARRQMQNKARDAFFDNIMTHRNVNPFLVLDVRRDCLVDDSLKAVSAVIGSGGEEIKKGLRIMFRGEEGIDGGGLRKEWFLLLVRDVFNPEHGLFLYDEDSRYCYFNPNSFETSDQFFLVGVVMGLAIYNSTILDVAFPPFTYRKLLAAAPTIGTGVGPSAHPRPKMKYTLEDLAEYRPRLAQGLQKLLDFEGDVETTFCLDFAIGVERYGSTSHIPLCPGGDREPVTNSNRKQYVDMYVRYLLDSSVSRQFEPFKRGFYTVCAGNAFSLFRAEEVEQLIKGSDEALDISSLRAVAEYHNWESKRPDDDGHDADPQVKWFWESFEQASPPDQRKLLLFISGSDRVPATGAALMSIKISCLGEDFSRFPVARTCFNQISLWRYQSKEQLDRMLWRAVYESEGFGLK